MSKWISDLEPWNEDRPKKLSVGDACRRIKAFRLRLNQLTQDIELDGQPLEAETVGEAYIDFSLINYAITKDQAIDAVVKVARSRAYDPVLDWLKDIEKDDSIVPIDLGTIARDYLGVDDKLSNRMFVMALLGAVWRRFHPGCKFDAVLTFMGAQSIRKSSAIQALAPHSSWITSSSQEGGKDQILALHRVWITELAELDHITGQKLPGWIKNMITTAEDLVRPPYGRTHKVMKRRSTLMASVNTGDFLKDDTGNRRFWVIRLPHKQYVDHIDVDKIGRDRKRIWKAVMLLFRQGIKPMLTAAEQAESERRNSGYMAENPFTSAVELRAMPWLLALAKAQGFTTRDAIERSMVCASVSEDQKVTQTKVTPDIKTMASCLRSLGFEQQPHATKDEQGNRTRRWFLKGLIPSTPDTGNLSPLCRAKSQSSKLIYCPQYNNTGLSEVKERNRAYARQKLVDSVGWYQRSISQLLLKQWGR